MSTWEMAGTVADIMAAVSAAAAAIFTYFTVINAQKTNQLAYEQMKKNNEYQDKTIRPVLDIKEATFTHDDISDVLYNTNTRELGIVPSYAANYFLEIENLGNSTARNIRMIVTIDNMKQIQKYLEENKELIKSKFQLDVKITEEFDEKVGAAAFFAQFFYTDKEKTRRYMPIIKNGRYFKELSYLKPSANDEKTEKLYLPKLQLMLMGVLVNGYNVNRNFPVVKVKLQYSDPFDVEYVQEFLIEPELNVYGLVDKSIKGKFVIRQISNKKIK